MKQTQTSVGGAWSVTVSEAGKEIATEQYATEAEAQEAVKRHREAGRTASAMSQKAPLQQQGAAAVALAAPDPRMRPGA